MSHTEFQDAPTATLTMPLAFRRTDDPSTTFDLNVDKATIGSGQSCAIRLIDAEVRPLHCLVTRSDSGLTIRRWADGTLLNGEAFAEAPLEIGDRLTIGPVELELVVATEEWTEPSDAHEADAASTPPAEAECSEENRSSDDSEGEQPAENPQPSVAVHQMRSRARGLVHTLREERETSTRLRTEVAELQLQVDGVAAERDQLLQQRGDLTAELGDVSHDLAQARDEIATLQDSHAAREEEFASQLSDLQRQIVDRNDLVLEMKVELERLQLARSPQPPKEDNAVETFAEQELTAPADDSNMAACDPPEQAACSEESTEFCAAHHGSELDESAAEPEAEGVSEHPAVEARYADSPSVGLAEGESIALLESPEPGTPEKITSDRLWEVEVQPDSEAQPGTGDVLGGMESESEDTSEHLCGAPTENEEDLWGRISSLRATASQKLHSEVEPIAAPTKEVTENPRTELPESDFFAEPAAEFGAESTESAPDEIDEAVSDSTELELVESFQELSKAARSNGTASDVPAMQEEREEHEEGEDDFVPPAIATTLFDAPPEKEAAVRPQLEPVSFVEKFKHLLDDGANSDTIPPAPMAEPVKVAVPAEKLATATDDDESVEDYMAKMMTRLRGGSQEVTADKPTAEPAPAPARKSVARASKSPTQQPLTPEDPLVSLDEVKTAPKPEQGTDMSALRDLANSSAREAISLANLRRARENATANFLMSFLAGSAGAYLAWQSGGEINFYLIGGASAIAGAGYWACRTLSSLAPPRSPAKKNESTDASTEVALPISGTSSQG